MAAVKTDYYEVLGVPRDADEETIRKAFHARARDCHPDVSDSPEDHRRFHELAEAYGVLSKAASRLLYDRYGYRGRARACAARRRPPPPDRAPVRRCQARNEADGSLRGSDCLRRVRRQRDDRRAGSGLSGVRPQDRKSVV